MNVLDLFSGIGGFSLGLERAGMKTVAFCEVDKKCQEVLRKHWKDVPIFDDVTTLKGADIEETVDVICGGFPCQDISLAGKGAGLEGERSGLWWEFHRLIKEIKPKYAIIENVSALRSRGLDQVLRSLSEIGYDAEWHCITASSVGAPHRRDRVWIISYPKGERVQGLWTSWQQELSTHEEETIFMRYRKRFSKAYWKVEPTVARVVDGFSGRVDRVKQLGNAVVPQIPELIGRAICQAG
jgi:DNA (cytosine-5)-methyltransferase 1